MTIPTKLLFVSLLELGFCKIFFFFLNVERHYVSVDSIISLNNKKKTLIRCATRQYTAEI